MTEQKSKKSHFWSPILEESELKNQVDNYYTLRITQSYRGISVLIMVTLLIASLLLTSAGMISDVKTIAVGIVIYLPFILFTYIGSNRWAIITLMVIWTFEKGVQAYTAQHIAGAVSPVVWWLIIMSFFYKAFQVENAKMKKSKEVSSVEGEKN